MIVCVCVSVYERGERVCVCHQFAVFYALLSRYFKHSVVRILSCNFIVLRKKVREEIFVRRGEERGQETSDGRGCERSFFLQKDAAHLLRASVL